MLKPYLLLVVLVISCLLPGSSHGQGALFVKLKTVDGDYTSLDELKGTSLTVIDFWATWCKPCVKSIPKLVDLSKEYEGGAVNFVGINGDSPRNISKVRPFAKSLRIDYPVLMDTDQELYNEFQIVAFPTLVIIDLDGKVLFTHEGYTLGDEKMFKSKIDELLNNENE